MLLQRITSPKNSRSGVFETVVTGQLIQANTGATGVHTFQGILFSNTPIPGTPSSTRCVEAVLLWLVYVENDNKTSLELGITLTVEPAEE